MALPQGWLLAKLNELISEEVIFCDGDWVESKDQDPNGDIRLIQLADIGDGRFIDKSSRFLTKEKAELLRCTYLQKDDILIARMPDPLGRATLFPLNGTDKYVTVVDVAIMRLGETISSQYICYMINALATRNEIAKQQSGTTRKRIARTKLERIEIPLPPLAEQHRIVAKIDALFSKLDKGVEILQTVCQQLRTYRQAVLKWAFDREGFTYCPLSELGDLGRGKSKHRPRNDPRLFKDGKYPFIQTGEVKVANGKIKNYTSMYGDFGLRQSKLWPAGTLCITIAANIAETAFLSIDACFPDSVVGFTANEALVVPEYVDFFIQSAKQRLWYYASATAQKNINLNTLENLTVPYCPKPKQEKLVAAIESRLSVCDKLEQIVDENFAKAQALRQSILKKAFAGQLVPQDPNDEPAEKLIERIKAAKTAATVKKRVTRGKRK